MAREVGVVKWFNDQKDLDLFRAKMVMMCLCITKRLMQKAVEHCKKAIVLNLPSLKAIKDSKLKMLQRLNNIVFHLNPFSYWFLFAL